MVSHWDEQLIDDSGSLIQDYPMVLNYLSRADLDFSLVLPPRYAALHRTAHVHSLRILVTLHCYFYFYFYYHSRGLSPAAATIHGTCLLRH